MPSIAKLSIDMLNILFISHECTQVLGSSKSLMNLIHSLKGQCHCWVLLPAKDVTYDYFVNNGVKCIVVKFHVDFTDEQFGFRFLTKFPFRILRDYLDNRNAIKYIAKVFKGIHIDIVHTNNSVVDFGPQLSKKLDAKHVWHLREFLDKDQGFRPLLGWKRLKKSIRHADAIISITHAIAYHFDVSTLPNSHILFDAVRSGSHLLQPILTKDKYFVFCGNITPHKSPDTAIRAFCHYFETHRDYKLLFIGNVSAKYQEELLSSVPFDCRNSISFLGYINNVDLYINKATALFMCSKNEAQGRVTVEAMLLHCPVIAANSGGTKEIIFHLKTGYLYDDDQECLQAMESIVAMPDLASEICDNAFAFAKNNFLEENYSTSIMEIYNQIMSKK